MVFDAEFFPTPPDVARRMVALLDPTARNVLEPSAGKGDLAEALRQRGYHGYGESDIRTVEVIESHPELAAILGAKGFTVVGHDWLTYDGVSYYDAIVLNPPFARGAEHVLRAWDFLHHGQVIALVNAETIANPCNATRMRLLEVINAHGTVEFLGACFRSAERTTDVKVALIHLRKTCADSIVDVVAATSEREVAGEIDTENWPAVVDALGNLEHYYTEATSHVFKAMAHLRRAGTYIGALGVSGGVTPEILMMALDHVGPARAEFSRLLRRRAWQRVFDQVAFFRYLDKKQREALVTEVESESVVPFTAANIKGTLGNVLASRAMLFEQSVANVFDSLTSYHKGNSNHTEGWKTNDSFKVNERLVFPWGCRFEYRTFNLRWDGAIDIYNDLDRVLCVLDKRDFDATLTIGKAMRDAFTALGSFVKGPFANTCTSEFFDIRFFMKGTVHLKWRRRDLWERFNIAASAGKRWIGEQTQGAGRRRA